MIRNGAAPCELSPPNSEHPSLFNDFATSAAKPGQIGKATNDLANLDLLRSVAVGLVFLTHLMDSMRIRGLGDLGHFGVLLFFVHTALVLMLSMDRLGLSGGRLYSVFVVRRVFRIYPLSILAVLLVVAFRIPSAPWFGEGVMGGFVWPGWSGLLSNVLLTQNITQSGSVICVLWSLPFEVQMYAFLPLLYILTRRFPSLQALAIVWTVGVIIAGMEYLVRSKVDSDFLLLRYFPCFISGVLAWRLLAAQRRRQPAVLWVLALMTLVTLYRMEDVLRVYGPNWQNVLHGAVRNDHHIWMPPFADLVRDWVFCGIAGLAITFFADIKSVWLNVITRGIARYSYGVYVCHIPIFWLCFDQLHIGNLVMNAILAVFLSAFVAFALYKYVEEPAIQIGKHLSTRLGNAIAPSVSTAS